MYEDASGVSMRECCDEIRVVVIGIMHACRQCVLNCALRGCFQCCCWQCFFFQALVMVSMWTLKNYTHWLMFWRAFFVFVSRSDRMDCHIADACFPLRCCVCVFYSALFCMRSILPLDFCCTSLRWSAIEVTSLPFRSVQEFRIRASFTARNQDRWSWCWSLSCFWFFNSFVPREQSDPFCARK